VIAYPVPFLPGFADSVYPHEFSTAGFFPPADTADTIAFAPWTADTLIPLRRSWRTHHPQTYGGTSTIHIDTTVRCRASSIYLNTMTEFVGDRLRDSLAAAVTLFFTKVAGGVDSSTDSLRFGKDVRNGCVYLSINDTCRAHATGDSMSASLPTSPRTRQVATHTNPNPYSSDPPEYFSDLVRMDVPDSLTSARLDSLRLSVGVLNVHAWNLGWYYDIPGSLRVAAITVKRKW